MGRKKNKTRGNPGNMRRRDWMSGEGSQKRRLKG